MATARVLHDEDDNLRPNAIPAPQNISIDANWNATPAACSVTSNQQVIFTNNSGGYVNITFDSVKLGTPPTVFNNVQSLSPIAPNNTNTQTAQGNNVTVNYYIQNGNNPPAGPFSIQVGTGPFYVEVTWDSTKSIGMVDPEMVLIPLTGTLQIYSGDQTSYNVSWENGVCPFNPAIGTVTPGVAAGNTRTANLAPGSYNYRVTKQSPQATKGSGGGTIKLG